MIQEQPHVIGIDVSKQKLQASLLLAPDLSKPRQKSVANNQHGYKELRDWAARQSKGQGRIRYVMEATGIYHIAFALFLFERGEEVYVVNPAQVKSYAHSQGSRTKTDEKDSAIIAHFGVKPPRNAKPFSPPPPEYHELRGLLARLEQIDKMIRQEKNRLEARPTTAAAQSIREHIEYLERERDDILRRMRKLVDEHPGLAEEVSHLESIPGVGSLSAYRLASMLEGGERFASARKFSAFLGLSPKAAESGTSVRKKPRLSKVGDAELRKALYLPALAASRYNPDVKALYDRLVAAGRPKMCALGAAMRKLAHIAFGVVKHRTAYTPMVAQT